MVRRKKIRLAEQTSGCGGGVPDEERRSVIPLPMMTPGVKAAQ